MINRFSRLFWGPVSPLSTFAGAGLIIMASSRTAYALVTLGALLWVYTLTAAVMGFAGKFLPRRGRPLVIIAASSLSGGLYLLILQLLNPFLALETSLYILFAPLCCHVSALPERIAALDGKEAILEALLEGLLYGALLTGLSLLREFLGLGVLSLPGGAGGIVEFFRDREFSLIPIRFLNDSAGAFLLLGYGAAFFNRLKTRRAAASAAAEAAAREAAEEAARRVLRERLLPEVIAGPPENLWPETPPPERETPEHETPEYKTPENESPPPEETHE
jgi:Na+-transporting NADH:ubiquinone oxidoreductase subunit NqrD